MEEWALNPLRRSRNKRQRSLLIEEDGDEEPLISDDDADDQTNCKNAHHRKWRNQNCSKRIFDWLFNGGWKVTGSDILTAICRLIIKKKEPESRTVRVGQPQNDKKYPPNITRNQKYSILSFLPLVLFEQFKFFLNFYFLVIAITQFFPELRIGALYTYWAPLGFVLMVTISREAYDDLKRFLRDQEANSQKYTKITCNGSVSVRSSDIRVSDVIAVQKDQKVPADMILLRTTEKNGSCFVRTDQLDGETDWKLRVAVTLCQQQLQSDQDLFKTDATVWAEKPHKDIYNFTGKFSCTLPNKESKEEPLGIENTLWANTVIASGTAVGLVIYTGTETRSVMNTSVPRSKIGLVDREINNLTKILFGCTILLSLTLTIIKGSSVEWHITLLRFILLFSYIIPISLRVNLDMGKLVYTRLIMRDKKIPSTIVRNSTIPEELGRVEYLMTDKTGTLTQNEMVFKKLCLGQQSYNDDNMNELKTVLSQLYPPGATTPQYVRDGTVKMSLQEKIHNSVLALAVCHNVTPVSEQHQQEPMLSAGIKDEDEETVLFDRATVQSSHPIKYQASSPDEVALVQWTGSMGMTLVHRELNTMQVRTPNGHIISYSILQIFPFKSETKRMGIVLQDDTTKEIIFFMKGADTVMANIVHHSDWLEEECDVMAREGLRTLVAGRRILTSYEYQEFERKYQEAKLSVTDRLAQVNSVVQSLENSLELLCVTGVEDQLQLDVRPTLELLRNAGIKIWMLTGDKLETAKSIALSSRLISRTQTVYTFKQVSNSREVHAELSVLRKKSNAALIITGQSLEVCLAHAEEELIGLACTSPVVVCCRCTPTHKEKVVQLLKQYARKPTCAVGDGGNDVSMIQAGDVGIGLVGKEGNQASLAADFSITQFSHLGRLLMWHGRNSYKRSASLSQFVMHRGLIISTMQAIFSCVNHITANSLYPGILMIGYTTLYTMAPVFSLVWDEDVSAQTALTFPELYKDLMKGQSLSYKTFIIWILISIYQGGAIMGMAYLLSKHHIVFVTFTVLLLTEFIMVALTIRTWHWIMLLAEMFSVTVYFGSLYLLDAYFDVDINLDLLLSSSWKILLLMLCSCLPLVLVAIYRRKCAPPEYTKLMSSNSMFRNCLCCTNDQKENNKL